jgi:hypothetical protein
MKAVQIVKISKLIPIYKDGVEANSINLVNFEFLNGDECGYNVISQKGLYEIGDKAIYIMPDYCLSDIALFESFTKPDGNPNKTKLGKMNRIRAIKFNFQLENSTEPIYSFGVLLPISEVKDYMGHQTFDEYVGSEYNSDALTSLLGITKYEEPEAAGSGQTKGGLPSFLYATDETNQETLKSKIKNICDGHTEISFSIKRDGSSFTEYFKKDENGKWYHGICSRNQEKKTEQYYISKYLDTHKQEYTRYMDPDTKVMGWKCHLANHFITDTEMETNRDYEFMTKVTTEVKDSWVELATKSGLTEKGMKYCQDHDVQLAFRGEIYGQGLKGSGNKSNPDANKKQGLYLFGVDCLDSGFAVRQNRSSNHNLEDLSEEFGIEYAKPVRKFPKNYEDFCRICEDIIAEEAAQGRIIEGVVARTTHTNDLSCKYMNKVYDAKK